MPLNPNFVGPSYNLDSLPSGVQRTINLIPVPQEPGNERTGWVFKDAPGLTSFVAPEGTFGGDELYAETIYLQQRGVKVDTSSYARSVADQGTAPAIEQVDADFPSGKCCYITGAHNAEGFVLGYGAEMEIGANDPFCMEIFVKVDVGALVGGAQIFYNTASGFNDLLWFLQVTTGRVYFRVNTVTDIQANVGVDVVAEGVCTYICCQVYDDDTIWMWVGEVGNATAAGLQSLSNMPRPVNVIAAGPYIGYVGGSGGVNAYKYDGMRITKGVRIVQGTTDIPIPTDLFPESL